MGPTSQSKRLPVSCEPCRKRKIRCTRNRPPCDTCLRRGLGPADCIYLGQPRHSLGQLNNGDISNIAQEELFQRIRNLEDLLEKHVGRHALENDLIGGGSSGGGGAGGGGGGPATPPLSNSTTAAGSCSPASTGNKQHFGSEVSDRQDHQFSEPFPADPMEQVVQDVGSLSISASGHVRYEPKSAMLNSQVAQQSSKDYTDELGANNEDEDMSGFPFAWENPPKRTELVGKLPPGPYCDTLKDVYFRVFSPLFHVLHDPTFEQEYNQFKKDPHNVSLSWLALLYVVLAIGVNGLDDDDPMLPALGRQSTPNANIKALAGRYRAGAMQCLAADGIMKRQSTQTLQTLVLLIYALNHASQPSWALVGMTHHIAISMGCHLDPDHFELDLLHAETRRRCWAGLVMLHMMQKISFRNLDEQRLSRRVRLPLDANDVELVDGAVIPQPPAGPTQMTYILFKFRLYDMALTICDQIFGSNDPSQTTVVKLDREIAAQQEEWNTRYHSDQQQQQEPLPDCHVAHMNILFGYSHQLVLLLHRPNLNRYLSGENSDVTRTSRDKCLDAARGLLMIQKHLTESQEFSPYKWYTGGLASFHAFHAAVVLATIAMHPGSGVELDKAGATLIDTVQVFRSLASRSALCEKAVPILSRLTNIVASSRPRSDNGMAPPVAVSASSNSSTPSTTDFKAGIATSGSSYSPQLQPGLQQQPPASTYLQFQQQQYPFTSTTPPSLAASSTASSISAPDTSAPTAPNRTSTLLTPPSQPPTSAPGSAAIVPGASATTTADPSPMLPMPPMFPAEALQAQLQAQQQWLGPSALTWTNWDFLLGDPDAQNYQQHYRQYAYEYGMSSGGVVPGAVAGGMPYEGTMSVLS